VDILAHKKPLSLKAIAARDKNPGTRLLVEKMKKKGLVAVTSQLKNDQVRMKKEKFVLLAEPPSLDGKKKLSKKRKSLLELVEEKKEISLNRLKQEIPTAPRLAKLLAGDGFLDIVEKQVFRDPFGEPVEPDEPPELTDEQKMVVNRVTEEIGTGFNRYLLSGVTGSGKTEVYMNLVAAAVDRGKGAIVLVPEISLISQTERRFRARFGSSIAVLHSGLSNGELLDQWQRIVTNEASIVIGARSSIFAPIENPGIVIVDEEHDSSYKQETSLRYNARDLAVVRAKLAGIPVVLGSATPSVQSYFNVCDGRFQELKLETRVNRHPLPEITLVDLKKYKDVRGREKIITPELSKKIQKTLDNGNQVLIFLNRRGFATFPVCESCGETVTCRFCDVTMTLHRDRDEFRCHMCGFAAPLTMKCPHCQGKKIKLFGYGTEKIEGMLKTLFPDARIARLDQDTGAKKGAVVSILKKVKNRTVDIVVGTQMLAKGHDFPAITLVGVVCADLSLNFPDFRAGERTFQLLAQVAGRAGRGGTRGEVILQTYSPDHFSIQASKNQDFREFYYKEVPFRKGLLYPPFSRIIQLKISGKDREKVEQHAALLGQVCRSLMERDTLCSQVQMLGPIEAGIPKIAMRYRWQLLLKSPSAKVINRLVRELVSNKNVLSRKDVSVGVDVDPYSMM
ncbi:MAG TPA: primosomal protein N', partial [Desulfobacteraceae bacterium]|nr:primosomal protein N' [Desulfobacteraceae bacterium]